MTHRHLDSEEADKFANEAMLDGVSIICEPTATELNL